MCSSDPTSPAPSYLELERQRDQLWDEVIAARGRIAAAEARCAEMEKGLCDAQAEASTVRRHYLHEKALKDAALAARDRLAKALAEIESRTGHFAGPPEPPDWMPMLGLIAWVGRTARAALAPAGEEKEKKNG